MTRGIWGDDERYLDAYWRRFPGVWTHGDWASIDEDGYWYLHGRSDDTLNIAGKRIGPAELESAAVAHGGVAEAAAIGVPHDVKGEVAWIFCVLKPGTEATPDLRARDLDRGHRRARKGLQARADRVRVGPPEDPQRQDRPPGRAGAGPGQGAGRPLLAGEPGSPRRDRRGSRPALAFYFSANTRTKYEPECKFGGGMRMVSAKRASSWSTRYGSRRIPHRDRAWLGRASGSRYDKATDSAALAAVASVVRRRNDCRRRRALAARSDVLRHQRRAPDLRTSRRQRQWAAQPLVDPESGRGSAVRLLAHAVRHVVHTNVPEGRLSPGPRVRREPGVGAGRARLAAAHTAAVAELAPASQEPPRRAAGATSGSPSSAATCSAATASPSGSCSSAGATASFRLRVANS